LLLCQLDQLYLWHHYYQYFLFHLFDPLFLWSQFDLLFPWHQYLLLYQPDQLYQLTLLIPLNLTLLWSLLQQKNHLC
jgi:hypothetical protein